MNEELETSLTDCKSLPSLPTVATKIIELTSSDDFGLNDISDIVQHDIAIATKIIASANTAAYRRGEASTDIAHAVSRLGFKATMMIALSFSLAVKDKNTQATEIDTDALWHRSVASASIARLLARQLGSADAEACFLAGLVQDIGILALMQAAPETYADLNDGSHEDAKNAEIKTLGCDHAEVGEWLLKRWNLPATVIELVAASHKFSELTLNSEQREDQWCIAASGLLAAAMLAGAHLQAARLVSLLDGICTVKTDDDRNIVQLIAETVREAETLFETSLVSDPVGLLESSKEKLFELMTADPGEGRDDKIAQLEQRVSALEQQGRLDSLTGAINRGHFHNELDRLVAESVQAREALSLMFIDADHFKHVNDTHWHLAGDEVLKWLAKALQQLVRGTDLVGRYGGEEFVVILPGIGESEAHELGTRICDHVRASAIDVGEYEVSVTVSIGIAAAAENTRIGSTRELIFAADQAMYFAKQSGRDLCVGASTLPPPQTSSTG